MKICSGYYILFLVLLSTVSFAQNTSNKGKDFWLGYGNHVGGQQMVIYVTSDVNTSVHIDIKGVLNATYPVVANSIQSISIPQAAYLGLDTLSNKGIHLTADKPVVVYAHIYAKNVSGATLILPTNTLGKEYYSINYKQISNQNDSYSYFFIVAVEDNTEVEIIPSADTKDGMIAGRSYRKKLMQGEVYQVLGKNTSTILGLPQSANYYGTDLTGSKIRSISTTSEACKRIAVFSGSGKIGIGCESQGIGSSDNLYQQVYPTVSWGKKYITVPLATRNYDIYRVLKSDPSAVVKINNSIVPSSSFVNGLYYEFPSQKINVVESDKPIQVVQYSVTQGKTLNCGTSSEEVGDPEMIYLNSLEQNIENITVYSTANYLISDHYINVVIPTVAVPGFTLDGQSRNSSFSPVPGNEEYSSAQLSVSNGVHTLAASAGFNAIAYGFGAHESYGYSAGTNVKGLAVEARNKVSNKVVSSACINEAVKFKVSLAYQTNKIVWDMGTGSAPITVLYSSPDSIETVSGKTFYVYRLNQDISYNVAKDYALEITADKGNANDCGSVEVIPFNFSVYLPQEPKFSASTTCAGFETAFTDQTITNGRPVKTWFWDFGDGATSAEQNPKHIYSAGGKYNVSLTISNDLGCGPETYKNDVIVIKKPVAVFTSTGLCYQDPTIFTDKSVSETEGISKWRWDLGDGKTLVLNSSDPFFYTYNQPGTYNVKLQVETLNGCLSDILTQTITIKPKPVPDFDLPEVCLTDAFAEFINRSDLADSEDAVTWKWNFGDNNATTSNPNTSILKNPRHKYAATGLYTVTLTAVSANGCAVTKSKTFKVNGSNPKAAFNVLNESALCSSSPVLFTNLSSVNFGDITRIEWYFDFTGNPLDKTVDEEPAPGKIYSHKYPEFNDPSIIRSYMVKQVVYSGSSCVNEIIKEIKLKPVPLAELTFPEKVCISERSFQLQVTMASNFTGEGVYSGKGVSASGLFSPADAGPGTHAIRYIFTPVSGCADTVIKNITVFPVPLVNAGNEKIVLSGGETELSVVTSGNIVSYKWSPATGLNRTDIKNPITNTSSDITYTVTVTSDNGCTATDQVKVRVLDKPDILNTFTPNNDGINDVWNIKYLDTYPNCRVDIFTRYGVKVYTSIGYTIPWDGRSQGVDLPVGTYYYIIKPGNGRKEFSGSVTIIR